MPAVRVRFRDLRTDEFLALLLAYERKEPVALRGDEWEVVRLERARDPETGDDEFVFELRLTR